MVPELPHIPGEPSLLQAWSEARERGVCGLKPGCAERLHWDNPAHPSRTPVALVYLHGFSASPGESGDQPERLAKALAANAFVARLPGHGLEDEFALQGTTPEDWLRSAREALAIGLSIGERVVVVGTSLGASLACVLAGEYPDHVAAVVAWSLGVQAHCPEELDRRCTQTEALRDKRRRSRAQQRYWSSAVHPDGYRALRRLFDEHMSPALAARVRAPFFLAYYYRDEQHQDPTASVPAMLAFFGALGTRPALKREQAFANGAHVVGSPWRSEAAHDVLQATSAFLVQALESERRGQD